MDNQRRSDWRQRLRTDISVLSHLFPWPIGSALLIGLAVTALIFQQAYNHASSVGSISYIKAVYAVLNMVSFQVSFADMPPGPALDPFFVVVPLVGIPLLLVFGLRLLNIVRVFFVRQERGQTWQQAFAATIEQPIVVCGLGHVGYRIADALLELERLAVGIETVGSPLVDELVTRGLPVIMGDIRQKDVLRNAGADRAQVVIVCTHDDIANIEAAFHVRELNPGAKIVLRLFEDEIADTIEDHFEVAATLSRSALAAQAFAYAALGIEAIETFIMDDQTFALTEVPIHSLSPLKGQRVSQIEATYAATVVCVFCEGTLITEPQPDLKLYEGDTVFIFTEFSQLSPLTEAVGSTSAPTGTADEAPTSPPILVCGIGHTGYRVVRALRDLERPVIALAFEPTSLSKRLQDEGFPVHYGDFRQRSSLEEVGLASAQALITCTEDDMVNFETGIRARELNPDVRIVMRLFEEALGDQLQTAFDINAVYSTSTIAAPAFIAAGLNLNLSQPITLGGEELSIARMRVENLSGLFRERVDALHDQAGVTVLLHKRDRRLLVPPHPETLLRPGDEIVLLATWEKLRALSLRNRSPRNL
jgi:Trk K+ transport system NAD-binding subunit